MSIYLVKEEDTIDKIAGLYDVSVEEIAYINQIPYPYRLAVGEALLIPDGVSSGVKMTASANGYAYPYINRCHPMIRCAGWRRNTGEMHI